MSLYRRFILEYDIRSVNRHNKHNCKFLIKYNKYQCDNKHGVTFVKFSLNNNKMKSQPYNEGYLINEVSDVLIVDSIIPEE